MKFFNLRLLLIVLIGIAIKCLIITSSGTILAQDERQPFSLINIPYTVESGVFNGIGTKLDVREDESPTDGSEEERSNDVNEEEGSNEKESASIDEKAQLLYTTIIRAEETPWMRIHFGSYNLGENSYIKLTSLLDGDSQYLDANYMLIWSDTSGIFNGTEVELELYVSPQDNGIFVNVDSILVAHPDDFAFSVDVDAAADQEIPESICGDFDDRVLSNDSRVGRLFFGGCTGWLVHNGAALTAGHCGTPDGNLSGRVLEFNVPLSTSNGVPRAASLNDQYPVTSVRAFEADGEGEDYNVFAIGPNSNTDQRAHIVQGFFHMTELVPSEGNTVRVTGYGLDPFPGGTGGAGASCCDWDSDNNCNRTCNSRSLVQQTDTGACDDCLVDSAIEHEVDTLPANSGSPVIWESNNLAIAIHTHGGCDSFFSDFDNAGTWLGYNPLQNALHSFQANARYADAKSITPLFLQTGNVLHPYKTITQAVSGTPSGRRIAIVAGSYKASAGNTFTAGANGKSLTLFAPVGQVTIGN